MKINLFKQGKRKAEELKNVQEFRNILKSINRPDYKIATGFSTTAQALKYHEKYYQKVAKLIYDADNLPLTPEARKIIENLRWVRQLSGMSGNQLWDFIKDEKLPYGLEKMYRELPGLEKRKDIDERDKIKMLESQLGITTSHKTLPRFVGAICYSTMEYLYKCCEEVQKSLAKSSEKAPKISIMNIFRGGKTASK